MPTFDHCMPFVQLQYRLYDFLPVDPQNLGVALTLLSGGSSQGEIRERHLSRQPPSRYPNTCACMRACKRFEPQLVTTPHASFILSCTQLQATCPDSHRHSRPFCSGWRLQQVGFQHLEKGVTLHLSCDVTDE
jgi:hypothetical protein